MSAAAELTPEDEAADLQRQAAAMARELHAVIAGKDLRVVIAGFGCLVGSVLATATSEDRAFVRQLVDMLESFALLEFDARRAADKGDAEGATVQ